MLAQKTFQADRKQNYLRFLKDAKLVAVAATEWSKVDRLLNEEPVGRTSVKVLIINENKPATQRNYWIRRALSAARIDDINAAYAKTPAVRDARWRSLKKMVHDYRKSIRRRTASAEDGYFWIPAALSGTKFTDIYEAYRQAPAMKSEANRSGHAYSKTVRTGEERQTGHFWKPAEISKAKTNDTFAAYQLAPAVK